MSKEDKGQSKRDLVEILETDCEEKEQITLLLEKTLDLKIEKERIEVAYEEAKEDLGAYQKVYGFENGLRHNHIAFVMSHREGRSSIDGTKLVTELVERGVDPTLVRDAVVAATKQGKDFYVKEVVDLRVKKGGRTSASKGEWGGVSSGIDSNPSVPYTLFVQPWFTPTTWMFSPMTLL